MADLATLAPLARWGRVVMGFKEKKGRPPTATERADLRKTLEQRRYPGLCALRLGAKPTPNAVARIVELRTVRSLSLRNIALDSAALFLVSGIHSLMALDLAFTQISERDIPTLIGEKDGEGRLVEAHEPRLEQLRVLHLGGLRQQGTDLKTLEMCLKEAEAAGDELD